MKFNVTVGSHPAQIELTMDGQGGFTGVISHTQYGDGEITGGVITSDELKGDVSLGRYNATFKATLSGPVITGRVELNWLLGADFTGCETA